MPDLLFKFKAITTIDQLDRFIDSINNNKLYFPTYDKLNDPLESDAYDVSFGGYAGCGTAASADEPEKFALSMKENYRVLALTENCFSPCMWAHYTNEHHGVCIGYWTNGVFSTAKKVEYVNEQQKSVYCGEYDDIPDDKIEEEIEKSFFFKHLDWSYEKEWRIVSKTETSFFEYNSDDLACIIIGDKVNENIKKYIIDSYRERTELLFTKIGHRSFGIDLLPYGEEIKNDGSAPHYIKCIDSLLKRIQ